MHDLLNISLIRIDQLKHGNQISILGHHFPVDDLIAVRAGGF